MTWSFTLLSLLIAFISAAFTALITFTVTTIAYRKVFKEMIVESLRSHEQQWHQDSLYQYTEKVLREHELSCAAFKRFSSLEKAIVFLVGEAGGNPVDYGLMS